MVPACDPGSPPSGGIGIPFLGGAVLTSCSWELTLGGPYDRSQFKPLLHALRNNYTGRTECSCSAWFHALVTNGVVTTWRDVWLNARGGRGGGGKTLGIGDPRCIDTASPNLGGRYGAVKYVPPG